MTIHRFIQKIVSSFKKATGVKFPALQPGETVNTHEVGDTHSGKYYVDRVSHEFHANSYKQRLKLKRNATDISNIESDD